MSAWRSFLALRTLTGLRYRDLIVPVLTSTLTLLSALTLTVVSAWLIVRSWQMPPIMDLTVAVTAVRALGISRAVFRYLDRLSGHRLALDCAAQARTHAYRLLATRSGQSLNALQRGAVTTTLTRDIDAVADVIVRAVVPASTALLTGLLTVGFTAMLSLPAAGVLGLSLVLTGLVAPALVGRSVATSVAARADHYQAVSTNVDRILTDSPALRIRGELDSTLAETRRSTEALARADDAGGAAESGGAALAVATTTLTTVCVLFVAISGYATGGNPEHSPQWLGVLVLLSLASFEATSTLPDAAVALTRARSSARRLSSLLHNHDKRKVQEGAQPGPEGFVEVSAIGDKPHLRAIGLTYGHDSAHPLGTIDLDLPFGARTTLTAPSGSGKTTLLTTLAGLSDRLGGRVLVDGVDVAALEAADPEALHRLIAYLPEDGRIFATTVRDNLAVGAQGAGVQDMDNILDAVGLRVWADSLPEGLDTVLTHGEASLSGGQRRRLLLARMLLTQAPIVLLDEPFEHLDAAGEKALEGLLAADELPGVRAQRTVVIVRHPR